MRLSDLARPCLAQALSLSAAHFLLGTLRLQGKPWWDGRPRPLLPWVISMVPRALCPWLHEQGLNLALLSVPGWEVRRDPRPARLQPALLTGAVGGGGCFSFTVLILLRCWWVPAWVLIMVFGIPRAACERSFDHHSLQRGGQGACSGLPWGGALGACLLGWGVLHVPPWCHPPPETPHSLSSAQGAEPSALYCQAGEGLTVDFPFPPSLCWWLWGPSCFLNALQAASEHS